MTISTKVRGALRQRADGACEVCGLAYPTNAHHRKNRSQAGGDELSNLLAVCGSGTTGCHGYITEHPAESYLKGWSVRSTEDPREVPVLYRGSLVTLDDLGNLEDYPGSGVVA